MNKSLMLLLLAVGVLWLSGRGADIMNLPFLFGDKSDSGLELPARVEGYFSIDGGDGPKDDTGYQQTVYGRIQTAQGDVLVEVKGVVLKRANIPLGGARVRMLLQSQRSSLDGPVYTVTSVSVR